MPGLEQTDLSQCFAEHHGHGGCEIKASDLWVEEWNLQAVLPVGFQ